MTQLRFAPAASAVLLLALVVTGRAQAHDCTTNTDCEMGFECQAVGTTGCAAPAPACPPNETCPQPDPAPCKPVVLLECVPAQCTSDAQCGDGMVCHATTQDCGDTACACSSDEPNCECAVPACDPQTVSYCTPKYALPCTVAADCGAGFTCEQLESCGCSGSAGSAGGSEPAPGDAARPLPSPGAAGAPASDPLPPDCSCEPSGQFACVPQEIECGTGLAACPAGWSCETRDAPTSSPACAPGENCEAEPAPQPLPMGSFCYPNYYGGGVGIGEDGGTPPKGEPTSGTGNGTPSPEAAATPGDADANESAACQMGHAPASQSALGILAMLGALLGLTRRRSQARA